MSTMREGTLAMRAALAALALAIVLAGWALVRALRIDAVRDAAASTLAAIDGLGTPARHEPADIRFAVDNDPFAPDRTAPARRYRMPGEPLPATGGESAVPPAEPLLLGTAVGDGLRSFATCQLPDGPPVILRVGDRIGVYTLKSIERGRVVFMSASGKRLEVRALTSDK